MPQQKGARSARLRCLSDKQSVQRIVTGAGSGGTTVGCAPETGASWA
jgi:hypothetical protein